MTLWYCAVPMCDESFTSRSDHDKHVKSHPNVQQEKLPCPVCPFEFDDIHKLEVHKAQTGHGKLPFSCEICGERFGTHRRYESHLKESAKCGSEALPQTPVRRVREPVEKTITCSRCPDTFSTQDAFDAHRAFPHGKCADYKQKTFTPPKPPTTVYGYVDLDKPKDTATIELSYSSDTPDDLSENDVYCHLCKTVFQSQSKYVLHFLGCSVQNLKDESISEFDDSPASVQPLNRRKKKSKARRQRAAASKASSTPHERLQSIQFPKNSSVIEETLHNKDVVQCQPRAAPRTENVSIASIAAPTLRCNINGCTNSYKTEPALNFHKLEAHGIKVQAEVLKGQASQNIRKQLKADGVLFEPARPKVRKGRDGQAVQGPPQTFPQAMLANAVARNAHAMHDGPPTGLLPGRPSSTSRMSVQPTSTVSGHSMSVGGPEEIEQAALIQKKVMRLLIAVDIFIDHGGSMIVGGINWVRIPVFKQAEVTQAFDTMCHLRKSLQNEYLPSPKTYADDYHKSGPVAEFAHCPTPSPSKLGMKVIAIVCSKIILAGDQEEIVKIAAIDVLTCNILLNHLVCADPHAKVQDWRTSETGLTDWSDFENARGAGYCVIKGWSAARSILWKFIDTDTIILGHNLRADMDALRLVHGRAVDMAKTTEKAAGGPLSKAQASLKSLCRDQLGIELKNDAMYGSDTLMSVFAVRQLALHTIKNKARFEQDMKQRSIEFQRIKTSNGA